MSGKLIAGYYDRMDKVIRNFIAQKCNLIAMEKAVKVIISTKKSKATVYVIGNGGSSAVAEHIAIDLTKNAGLRALSVSGSPMLTTFSNDYGYKNVFKKYIEIFAKKNDVLIAISSGGRSENILNACREAKKRGLRVITLSGFDGNNPLRKLGNINFWVDSKAFGFLETIHGLILHWINDSIIGNEIYMIR